MYCVVLNTYRENFACLAKGKLPLLSDTLAQLKENRMRLVLRSAANIDSMVSLPYFPGPDRDIKTAIGPHLYLQKIVVLEHFLGLAKALVSPKGFLGGFSVFYHAQARSGEIS